MTDSQTTLPPPKKSDLGTRTLSAIVMVMVSGAALWLGGWFWGAFVAAVALGVLWEWRGLVLRFDISPSKRWLWLAMGVVYIGAACLMLLALRSEPEGAKGVLLVIAAVIGTDVGAYFSGRAIGGPKIAPRISPSKTWAGLFGGMVGATIALIVITLSWDAGVCELLYPTVDPPPNSFVFDGPCSGVISAGPMPYLLVRSAILGALIAIVAQTGDFFESWMKRRAGVKDSSNLIPGHGGLFDRVDGLLAVLFVAGLAVLGPVAFALLSGESLLPSPA